VKRGDDGHSQLAQQGEDVAAAGPTENSEFVLQADNINVADIQKVGGAKIRRKVLLFNFKANDLGVFVAFRNVVDRNGEAVRLGVCDLDSRENVGSESCNAAFSWQMVGDKRNLSDFIRSFFQVTLSARTINLSGAAPTK